MADERYFLKHIGRWTQRPMARIDLLEGYLAWIRAGNHSWDPKQAEQLEAFTLDLLAEQSNT